MQGTKNAPAGAGVGARARRKGSPRAGTIPFWPVDLVGLLDVPISFRPTNGGDR